MRKKGHYNPFVAKKIKDKKKKFLAEKAFPKKEFNEYWGKHSDEIFRAVYDDFLDELATGKVFMMLKGPYGRSHRQEVNKGNISKFCEY